MPPMCQTLLQALKIHCEQNTEQSWPSEADILQG